MDPGAIRFVIVSKFNIRPAMTNVLKFSHYPLIIVIILANLNLHNLASDAPINNTTDVLPLNCCRRYSCKLTC